MIVDDEANILESTSAMLEDEGYQVYMHTPSRQSETSA